MPPLPEGDFRFLTAPWSGDIGVDQEMSCAVSRSAGSKRPSQMGREGSRVAVTAGRVAAGTLMGRKYDWTEVLLTSLVRRILGEGFRFRPLVSRGEKDVSSPASSGLSVSLDAFSHLSADVGCCRGDFRLDEVLRAGLHARMPGLDGWWRGDIRLDAVLRAGLNAWMLGLRASLAVIVRPIIVSVSEHAGRPSPWVSR